MPFAGYTEANVTALRAEAGVWDQGTRVDMLLLRMFCKFASSVEEAPFYRAMYLSLEAVERGVGGPALSKWQAVNKLQHQPWGQQLLAAADRLGVTLSLPPAPPVVRAVRVPPVPVVLNPAVPHVVVNRGALQQRAAAGPALPGLSLSPSARRPTDTRPGQVAVYCSPAGV